VGPLRPRPPGLSLGAFLGILLGCGVIMLGTALVIVTVLFVRERSRRERRDAELLATHRVAATARNEAGNASASSPHADLPTITRHVPTHSLRLLEGCSQANLIAIADVLGNAIEEGAPLYNSGNFAGCYQAYVGSALDLEHRMPRTCAGPARALADGRATANGYERVSEKAWAMRDAFDGLLDVVARSLQVGGGASL
jgi:hypothetical protein